MPDLEVEAKQRLREAEVEANPCNASKDVMLSHTCKVTKVNGLEVNPNVFRTSLVWSILVFQVLAHNLN